jgi:hypothetical protein
LFVLAITTRMQPSEHLALIHSDFALEAWHRNGFENRESEKDVGALKARNGSVAAAWSSCRTRCSFMFASERD